MATYSDKETERILAELEKKIYIEYSKASKGLTTEYDRYIKGWDEVVDGKNVHHKGVKERIAKEYIAYQNGKYTDQQWKSYLVSQIGRGERWKTLRDDMARKITDTNLIANAYINDTTPGIYSLNYNFSAYEIEKQTGVAFNVYNEQAVKRLMMDENSTEFRVNRVNPKRDYKWNKQRIDSALIGGILQGKSIEKLSDSFLHVMQSNSSAAIRNARTSVTSAQNAGRQECFNLCVEMGIEMQKEWVSAHDARTRDSHAQLDGVRVNNDEKFPNGLEYPGDPKGAPEEVYNCRCAMRAVLPRYANAKHHLTGNTVESYKKWLKNKT